MLTPFLHSAEFNHRDYLLAGLYPPATDAPALPPARFRDAVQHQPNLVFGEVEGTGSRVEDGFCITQVSRMVFQKPQMPSKAAGTVWLKTVEQLILAKPPPLSPLTARNSSSSNAIPPSASTPWNCICWPTGWNPRSSRTASTPSSPRPIKPRSSRREKAHYF